MGGGTADNLENAADVRSADVPKQTMLAGIRSSVRSKHRHFPWTAKLSDPAGHYCVADLEEDCRALDSLGKMKIHCAKDPRIPKGLMFEASWWEPLLHGLGLLEWSNCASASMNAFCSTSASMVIPRPCSGWGTIDAVYLLQSEKSV